MHISLYNAQKYIAYMTVLRSLYGDFLNILILPFCTNTYIGAERVTTINCSFPPANNISKSVRLNIFVYNFINIFIYEIHVSFKGAAFKAKNITAGTSWWNDYTVGRL